MTQPLVSIVIPAKNRATLIGYTLDSLCKQTRPSWQAVVVDDASKDDTFAQAKAWSDRDSRIRVLRRQGARGGAQVCRNQGIEAADGDFIILLDSDDLLAPHCVEQRMRVMEDTPALDFAVSPMQMMNNEPGDTPLFSNAMCAEDDLDRFCAADLPWMITGPIWRRSVFRRVGMWKEEMPCWQDWEFHVRALAHGLRYQKISTPDCHWRVGHMGRINSSFGSAAYCQGLAMALPEVWTNLHRHGKTTDLRRSMLTGLLVILVMRLLNDDAEAARDVWRLAMDSMLLTSSRGVEGAWLLKRARGNNHSQACRDYLARRFPEHTLLQRIFDGRSPVGRAAVLNRPDDDKDGIAALLAGSPRRSSRARAVASLLLRQSWRRLRRSLSKMPVLWRLVQHH